MMDIIIREATISGLLDGGRSKVTLSRNQGRELMERLRLLDDGLEQINMARKLLREHPGVVQAIESRKEPRQ